MTAPDGKVLWGGPPYIDSPKQAGLAPMLKSTPHADMDRRAAEAVLRHGGTVVIRVGEAEAEIKPSNGSCSDIQIGAGQTRPQTRISRHRP